jgi:hypothetical protein
VFVQIKETLHLSTGQLMHAVLRTSVAKMLTRCAASAHRLGSRELPKRAVHVSMVCLDVLARRVGPTRPSIFEPALPGSNAASTEMVAARAERQQMAL